MSCEFAQGDPLMAGRQGTRVRSPEKHPRTDHGFKEAATEHPIIWTELLRRGLVSRKLRDAAKLDKEIDSMYEPD